jgi:hypothetical protein
MLENCTCFCTGSGAVNATDCGRLRVGKWRGVLDRFQYRNASDLAPFSVRHPAAETARDVCLAAQSISRATASLEATARPPTAVIEALRQHKAEIVKLLTSAEPAKPTHTNGHEHFLGTTGGVVNGDPLAKHDNADWAARAAIMEYDRGVPRRWAEAQGHLTSYPPFDVSQRQWDQLRDDFGRFLDGWAHVAERLGWPPSDLLGWTPPQPYSPIAKRIGIA